MDVHRARFVPYPTSAISALAFSRSSDSGYSAQTPPLKLALGRANGDIEIWDPQRGSWVQEVLFPGDNAGIDGLAWTQDADEKDVDGEVIPGQHRLFSIASSPSLTEWDLATGMVKRRSTGNFSEVWCLAAQPRWKQQKSSDEEAQGQDLIAGCGDGTIVLLDTADGDLQFKRFLARVAGKKAKCMCITYQTREKVVAGFADGMIRIYDTRNASLLRTMSLGVSVPGATKNALVWQVRCLGNGDIVSGDSNGEVKIWDGRTYSMLQRLHAHDSDCLDLVVSNDGRTMMSGSIDGKIAIYRQTTNDHGRKSWAKGAPRRLHNGEVKAMTAFDSKGMSVVVSGGSDASPRAIPLREYGKENPRALPALPRYSPVASAKEARLLVSWWEHRIMVWRIATRSMTDADEEDHGPKKLVAKIDLDTKTAIRSVAISTDGKVLAASTSDEVKIFQLQQRGGSDALAVRKLHLPKNLASAGGRLLQFSDDSKWLAAVTPESEVYVARLARVPDRPKYLQVLSKVVELDRRRRADSRSAFKSYIGTINQVAFSTDSSVLAASDLAGYIDSWVLEGHEDVTAPALDVAQEKPGAGSPNGEADSDSSSDSSDEEDGTAVFFGQHWTDNPSGHLLPKLQSPAVVLTFRPQSRSPQSMVNGNPGVHSTRSNPHAHSNELPQGDHRLFVLTSKHQIYEFDVLAGRLSDWSRRNPTSALPQDFLKIRDRVMGASWDVRSQGERLWLYGNSFVCMFDLSGDLADAEDGRAVMKKRRKPKAVDETEDSRKRQRLESGAGGKVLHQRGANSTGPVTKFDKGSVKEVELDGREQEADDDDDDDDLVDFQLTRVSSSGEQGVSTALNGVVNGEHHARKWFCTFRYRPILGMVALEDDAATEGDPLEVVIVERPMWDVKSDG